MPANYVLLEKITVGAAGASSVTFSSIPQTGYTDLVIKSSARTVSGGPVYVFQFNGSSTGWSYKSLEGYGSGTPASAGSSNAYSGVVEGSNTANTFNNNEHYIPNYAGSSYKTISCDSVTENNGTAAYATFYANSWSNTAAIASITITPSNATNFVQYSTFYLYGVAKLGTTPAISPYATGGDTIITDGTYWYHTFISSGTFTPRKAITCDYLVVAGGGGGGIGGGGAGGLRSTVTATGGGGSLESALSLASGTGYTVTIGAGGGGYSQGSNSVFSTITSTGGGAGQITGPGAGGSGGSGGGAATNYNAAAQSGGTAASPTQGYAGGGTASFTSPTANTAGGGGGGAGAVGGTATRTGTDSAQGGNGGAGVATSISGSSVTYAGGGGGIGLGGGGYQNGTGGTGGGAAGNGGGAGINGTANTGGGGGAGYSVSFGSGGSGIVIVRYPV